MCTHSEVPDSFPSLSADDTNYEDDKEDERKKLQKDIYKLGQWFYKWLIEFNSKRCKEMKLGTGNGCLD